MHAEPNPYAAPSVNVDVARPPDGPVDVDRELAATQLSAMVKASAAMVASTGVMLVMGALQLWDVVSLQGVLRAVPIAMALLGMLSVVIGMKIYRRQRVWAAVAATVLSGLVVIGMGVWFVFSTLSGFISVLAMLVPLLAALATIFSGLAIGPCRRTAAARRRLAASGLDVDF